MSLVAGSLPAESLQIAADMMLIDRHMSRYTWLVDARRYAEWAALFTPDAIFEQAWQDAEGKLHPVNFGAGLRLQGRTDIARFVAARFGPEVPANLPRPAAGVGHRLQLGHRQFRFRRVGAARARLQGVQGGRKGAEGARAAAPAAEGGAE